MDGIPQFFLVNLQVVISTFACRVILQKILSADFFSKLTFSKYFFRGTIRVSNTWDPDQGDILSGLILVRNICKGYQQTTLAGRVIRTPIVPVYFC